MQRHLEKRFLVLFVAGRRQQDAGGGGRRAEHQLLDGAAVAEQRRRRTALAGAVLLSATGASTTTAAVSASGAARTRPWSWPLAGASSGARPITNAVVVVDAAFAAARRFGRSLLLPAVSHRRGAFLVSPLPAAAPFRSHFSRLRRRRRHPFYSRGVLADRMRMWTTIAPTSRRPVERQKRWSTGAAVGGDNLFRIR